MTGNPRMAVKDEYGTVRLIPYVGDTQFIAQAECAEGDWENSYKGQTIEHAYRSMLAHYKDKHKRNVQMPTPTLIKLGKERRDGAKRASRGERSHGKFPVGSRVMTMRGDVRHYGKVTGHEAGWVKVWWDSGDKSLDSPTRLTLVPKDRI